MPVSTSVDFAPELVERSAAVHGRPAPWPAVVTELGTHLVCPGQMQAVSSAVAP